jgi:hypothetical protein
MSTDRWFIIRGATETPALQKLDKVSRYPPGWAHGDGDAFSADVVKTARRVLTIAASLGLDGTDVFPRRDGGLVASVYTGLDVHDFTVHADGTLEWLHEHDDVEIESQPVTFAELEAKLIELARPQWHSYGYSWQTIMISAVGVSRAPHSLPQAPTERSPASIGIAPSLRPVDPAST